jgi:hypothetical protein
MCTSLNATFAWVGAILVNIGFVALISWGASTLWPIGFVLSALYTASLFELAKWLQQRELEQQAIIEDEIQAEESTRNRQEEEHNRSESTSRTPHTVSLPVNLLYGLAVVSLGATCFLLPINLIDNCNYYDHPGNGRGPRYEWVTNATSLPPGVRKWAKVEQGYFSLSSFGYVADTKTTLFRANFRDYPYCLWSVNATSLPHAHQDHLTPDNFATVSNNAVCFTSTQEQQLGGRKKVDRVSCSNGSTFRAALPIGPLYKSGGLNSFFTSDNILWFKQTGEQTAGGTLIYSLDPGTMKTKLYSSKVQSGDDKKCSYSNAIRKQAIVTLLVAALPVTLTSIVLWYAKQVPSMAITTFAGLTAVFLTLYATINPHMFERYYSAFDVWSKWWFCSTGLLWLVVLTCFNLSRSTSDIQRPPLQWGLAISGIAFMLGTWSLLPMERDDLLFWMLLNVLVFAPLLLFGIVNSNMFVVVLGGIGVLVDAGRFASYIGNHVPDDAQAPVTCLVFSLAGLMVGAIGFKLGTCQTYLQIWAVASVQWLDDNFFHPVDNEEQEEQAMHLLQEESADSATAIVVAI